MQPASGNPQGAAYDGNGNVMGLVDAGPGALNAWEDYGPFGEPLKLVPCSASDENAGLRIELTH
jgi:hypothetical protein